MLIRRGALRLIATRHCFIMLPLKSSSFIIHLSFLEKEKNVSHCLIELDHANVIAVAIGVHAHRGERVGIRSRRNLRQTQTRQHAARSRPASRSVRRG